ncbi:hypothetical protein [Wolbachia endosymbiont (group A) of Gymnosoma rotundatum]|nr:hypothetical protein [Wolbachia endosymbiont (group A) of Gymnosoma rotundatum]
MTPLGTAVIKEPVSAIRMTPSWMEITSRAGMTKKSGLSYGYARGLLNAT